MFGRKKRRIVNLLLVEDEPLVAFDNEHALTDAGFTVVATVDRVATALAALKDGLAIDLVVADVQLADGSGLDVARAAQALESARAVRDRPIVRPKLGCWRTDRSRNRTARAIWWRRSRRSRPGWTARRPSASQPG